MAGLAGSIFELIIKLGVVYFFTIFYRRKFFLHASIVVSLFILVPVFLPYQVSISLWLPFGLAPFVVSTYVLLAYRTALRTEQVQELVTVPPELSRKELKVAIAENQDPVESRKIYLGFIERLHRVWTLRDQLFRKPTVVLTMTAILFPFVILMMYLYKAEVQYHALSQYMDQAWNLFKAWMQNKTELPPKEEFMHQIKSYGAIFLFFQFMLSHFFVLWLVRKINEKKQLKHLPVGEVSLFVLPDVVIWVYIALGGMLLAAYSFRWDEPIRLVFTNLFAIFSLIYVLQGVGIFTLFLHLRYLPVKAVWLIIFLASLFFPALLLFWISLFWLIGILDFWFSFRKKALHPALILKS
ncbi:MAG: DUF2232 domain-containing protein [Candidatus Hydrogenedentota bacterium]|nr:MAG: DUF2232 domain-containing protein [Candidatus Hydrogenedentota bacterium]